MTHGERTLSGIAEELERRADNSGAYSVASREREDREAFLAEAAKATAYREAATLIRTADDREKVLREALLDIQVETTGVTPKSEARRLCIAAVNRMARQALGGTNA